MARLETEILIVGAGMAGLTAARELRQAGHGVLVIDKGRGVGGRLASRRIGAATFDHGAQFITARHPRFAAAVDSWLEAGVLEEWWRDPFTAAEARPRWRGCPSMTAVAKHLARDLPVELGRRLLVLHREASGWVAHLEAGEHVAAAAVLLTPPVPQSMDLLAAGGVELPGEIGNRLVSIKYDRCIAVLAVLEAPTKIPAPGGFSPTEGPIDWIADNQMKGVSREPAVTVHASAKFSLENWERDRQACGRELLAAARAWLGTRVTAFQVHGWLYSKPSQDAPDACLVLNEDPPLVLAGDAFGGPRVEGAALSGWAAADALRRRCRAHAENPAIHRERE